MEKLSSILNLMGWRDLRGLYEEGYWIDWIDSDMSGHTSKFEAGKRHACLGSVHSEKRSLMSG